MTVATLPLAGADTEAEVSVPAVGGERGPLGGAGGGGLGGSPAGLLRLLLGLGLLLRLGEVLLGLLGGLGGGRVALGLQLIGGRGQLGGLCGLLDLSGQVGGERGQFERLCHRLGRVRRSGRAYHCHGAEDATGNSGSHRDCRRRGAAGLPVAAYVSGVGHGTNRYQGLLHTFKKRVLRHSCSIGAPNPGRVTPY